MHTSDDNIKQVIFGSIHLKHVTIVSLTSVYVHTMMMIKLTTFKAAWVDLQAHYINISIGSQYDDYIKQTTFVAVWIVVWVKTSDDYINQTTFEAVYPNTCNDHMNQAWFKTTVVYLAVLLASNIWCIALTSVDVYNLMLTSNIQHFKQNELIHLSMGPSI